MYFSQCFDCGYLHHCKLQVSLHSQYVHNRKHPIRVRTARVGDDDYVTLTPSNRCQECRRSFVSLQALMRHWKKSRHNHLLNSRRHVYECTESGCEFLCASLTLYMEHNHFMETYENHVRSNLSMTIRAQHLRRWEDEELPQIVQFPLQGVDPCNQELVKSAMKTERQILLKLLEKCTDTKMLRRCFEIANFLQ